MSQSNPGDPAEDLPPTVDLPSAVDWSKPKLSRLRPFRLVRRGFLRLLGLFSNRYRNRYRTALFVDSLLERLAKTKTEISDWEEHRKKNVEKIEKGLERLSYDVAVTHLQLSTFTLGMRLSLAASAIERHERLGKIRLCLAKVSPIMDKHDWWIVEGLPITFYQRVLDTEDSLTTEELNNLITEFFNQDDARRLSEIVASWNAAAFSPRTAFFGEALWAHRNEKYSLSVSALISQVEGVVRDFVKTEYGFTHRRFSEVRAVFSRRFSVLSELLTDTSATVEEIVAIVNYYNLRKLEALYATYAPESHQEPDGLLRHAVAHGLWLNYGKVELSTRLFLLLDMLHSMLRQLESPN